MRIQNNVSSKPYNTFGLDTSFNTLITVGEVSDLFYLKEILKSSKTRILGGGSNILLLKPNTDPVILIDIKGIEILKEEDAYALVKFGAGEIWHDAVLWAIENNLGGIENLSLIPGKCGAAPMQNIGAYGVEIKDVLHSVTAYDTESNSELVFHNEECGFGYRTSNFKTIWKGRMVITSIILKLTKDGYHVLNDSYGAVTNHLKENRITQPSIVDLGEVISDIRRQKLPDPKVLGNSGSFFKNPIVSKEKANQLLVSYAKMPTYPVDADMVKLSAGWIIDQCGLKGQRVGDAGTYKNQALVLVNHGNATGKEIHEFSKQVQSNVKEKFGIELEPEVNIW